jgi:hypothetical protein
VGERAHGARADRSNGCEQHGIDLIGPEGRDHP